MFFAVNSNLNINVNSTGNSFVDSSLKLHPVEIHLRPQFRLKTHSGCFDSVDCPKRMPCGINDTHIMEDLSFGKFTKYLLIYFFIIFK